MESINYKEVNGTSYHEDTPYDLIQILEDIRESNTRVVFDYGDTKTLESWGEDCDIAGTIGRSTGRIKIPLLIKTKRSFGGVGIMDNRILSIKTSKGGRILYDLRHQKEEFKKLNNKTHLNAIITTQTAKIRQLLAEYSTDKDYNAQILRQIGSIEAIANKTI